MWAARREQILQILSERSFATAEELARLTGASLPTIRRDLQALAEEGLIVRTRGGASLGTPGIGHEVPYLTRARVQLPEKRAIARAALEFIREGDVIALDVGSTTFELAWLLRPRRNLTVFTASVGGVRGGFWNYFRNSFIITAGAMGLTLLLGLPAAFALARFKFLGRSHIAFTFLTFRFVPELSIILPLYIIFQKIKLYNTYIGLILAYQLITLPLFVWIIRVFFDNIPRELEEAALVDGANWWYIFWQVDLPLVRGGLAAAFILCAIFAWNNFIFGLILGAQDTQPLTVGVLGFMSYEQVLWGQMAAASMLIILPELAVVALVQRYIVQGLTLGALAHQ
jgi:multiple sugar transport system permease protein